MKKISFLIFLVFFSVGLYVLPHYGPNWDETTIHFNRGQSILHFFLTGKKDYKDLPQIPKYYQKDDSLFYDPVGKDKNTLFRRSIYMDNQINFNFFAKDTGHPPLSDIFSASFNLILFQKLGLINDIDSYHIYSIFLSSILVAVLFFWVSKKYGKFAGLISSMSLALYPLFLGESHFNIKDPPEAVFYSLAVLTFFEGVVNKKNKLLILSSIFAGFAFATKFNAVFIPFTLVPWLVIYFINEKKHIKKYFSLIPSILIYPFVPFAILFASWPFLWDSPLKNFLSIVDYYTSIGTNSSFDPRFMFFHINTYAIRWILYSTPIVILIFSAVGIFYCLKKGFKEKDKRLIFILLWFIVPIARVTRTDAGIYGGLRQIMEYVPPMAILAGIGAVFLRDKIIIFLNRLKLNNKIFIVSSIFVLSFIPITLKLISIHPNEGIYFNELIGGLKGAKEKDLPGWGDSLGNPYREGIRWINENAPKDSNVAINFGSGSNIYWNLLREDIHFSNAYRSASLKKGEYIIGLTHDSGFEETFYLQYLNNFLDPVYEEKVDGVPILKIWKNDLAHTKKNYRNIVPILNNPTNYLTGNTLFIDLGKTYSLAQMYLRFKGQCVEDREGSVQVSNDKASWETLDSQLYGQFLLPFGTYQNKDEFVYYFADKKARYIEMNFYSDNSCFKSVDNIKLYGFGK